LLTTQKYAKQESISSFRDLKHQEKIGFYKALSLAYKNIEDYKTAHLYIEKSTESAEKTNRVQILKNINTVEKVYLTKIEEQKAKILEDENLLNQKQFTITILILLAILLVSIFGVLYYRLRSKYLKRKIKLDALKIENQRVYADKLLKEKEITALELELKQKELTTNSISLLQKKEQYDSLIKRLKSFNLNISSKDQKEEFSNIISECVANKMSFNWEELKLTFEKVHSEFYSNLLKKHPDLSSNEKKICAFLKLGMNTKDIASVTNKIERTVITARSRLRKKMNLDKSVNLENYISSF
ncbi:MAG: hypothetical protein KBT69_05310, partial [Oceanihabitans sp.]|nr:hypothetical protein [Oceanihabitans sp.]